MNPETPIKTAPVSVIITTFNRPAIVREAVESVLAQTLPPAQIIVIDDGSKTDTRAALEEFLDRVTIIRQKNAGLCAARNHGIRLASQQWVAFLDDDDAWHPRKLEMQMRCMAQRPDLGMIGAEQFDWPARELPPIPDAPAEKMLELVSWERLVVRTLIPVSSVMMPRAIFERVGLFDTDLRSSEDRDMFLRIAEMAPIGMVRAQLSGYRDTPGSMCKNPAGREKAMRQVFDKVRARGAWRGRFLLWCKARSYMHHTCSNAHARAGNHFASLARTLKAMAYYPLPYRRDEVRMTLERPKRFVVNLLRLLQLKKPDFVPASGAGAVSGSA